MTAARPKTSHGPAPQAAERAKAAAATNKGKAKGKSNDDIVTAASVGPVHAEFRVDLSVDPRSNESEGAAPDEVLGDAAQQSVQRRDAAEQPLALVPVLGPPSAGPATADGRTSGSTSSQAGSAAAGSTPAVVAATPAPRPTADALAREAGVVERAVRSPVTTLRNAGRAVTEALPVPLPARSFALPFGFLAALGGYLIVQRRFRPGALPMSAAALPQQEGVRDRHRL